MNSLIGTIEKVLFVVLVLFLSYFIVDIWWSYPSNHGSGVGFELKSAGFFFTFGVIFLLVKRSVWTWGLVFLSVCFFAMGWIADNRNIKVDYDEWVARGMPKWGEKL